MGTAFTAVGFAGDKSGLKVAGLITLPLGLVGLAPSIWGIATSGAKVQVTPWTTGTTDSGDAPAK